MYQIYLFMHDQIEMTFATFEAAWDYARSLTYDDFIILENGVNHAYCYASGRVVFM